MFPQPSRGKSFLFSTSIPTSSKQRGYLNKGTIEYLLGLLQKCFLQEVGKGKRLKGKGKIANLSPFPLPLFPTSARSLLFLSCLAIPITNVYPAAAHKVEVAGDVGGTLHLEPNDNPRAGEPSQAWFALTRRGGKVIPLAQCNCQLAVYAEPYAAGEPALLEPTLKAVAAERYQGIPGAEIVFPKPGLYQLELNGKPASGGRFKPFEFKFEVTVAAGSNSSQNLRNVNGDVAQGENQSLPFWAIAVPILGFIAILFVALRGMRGGSGE